MKHVYKIINNIYYIRDGKKHYISRIKKNYAICGDYIVFS